MADPDLQIRWGAGVVIQTLSLGGGGGLQKSSFRPFGSHFGRKIRGGRPPRAPPLDPPLAIYSPK